MGVRGTCAAYATVCHRANHPRGRRPGRHRGAGGRSWCRRGAAHFRRGSRRRGRCRSGRRDPGRHGESGAGTEGAAFLRCSALASADRRPRARSFEADILADPQRVGASARIADTARAEWPQSRNHRADSSQNRYRSPGYAGRRDLRAGDGGCRPALRRSPTASHPRCARPRGVTTHEGTAPKRAGPRPSDLDRLPGRRRGAGRRSLDRHTLCLRRSPCSRFGWR